ncbi:MAG: heavy metal-binding domain-containing protein [Thermodesulfobacteriota bacterium]
MEIRPDQKLLLTTSTIPPKEDCEILGVIAAASVLSRNIVADIGATIKNTAGGELRTYTRLLDQSWEAAMERLQEKAISCGADGVFGIQVACSQISAGSAEVLLMGTAYRLPK